MQSVQLFSARGVYKSLAHKSLRTDEPEDLSLTGGTSFGNKGPLTGPFSVQATGTGRILDLARKSPPSPTRFPTVGTVSEQRHHLLGFRSSPVTEPERHAGSEADTTAEAETAVRRWGLFDRSARRERAEEREHQKQLQSVEEAKEAFFRTPAGKARLAYKRGHRLFQYELPINGLEPTIVPGLVGSPARETTDPVDILNSVTAEGWKLVTGKFIHSEMRSGAVGCYLFKRSQKRRLSMNNPWQAPSTNT